MHRIHHRYSVLRGVAYACGVAYVCNIVSPPCPPGDSPQTGERCSQAPKMLKAGTEASCKILESLGFDFGTQNHTQVRDFRIRVGGRFVNLQRVVSAGNCCNGLSASNSTRRRIFL